MAVVYKAIEEKYAAGFITGKSIRIGTLYDFRNEEKHAKGISDDREGRATSHISSTSHLKGYERALMNQDIKNLGFFSGPNMDFQFENSSITLNHPNCFIFCSCMEEPSLDAFNSTLSSETKYDAIVRINDIEKFAEMLAFGLRRGNLSSGKFLGMPIQYASDDWDYLEHGMKIPNPFEKNEIFKKQNEHRIIFESFTNDIKAVLADFDPFPSNLIERVV